MGKVDHSKNRALRRMLNSLDVDPKDPKIRMNKHLVLPNQNVEPIPLHSRNGKGLMNKITENVETALAVKEKLAQDATSSSNGSTPSSKACAIKSGR